MESRHANANASRGPGPGSGFGGNGPLAAMPGRLSVPHGRPPVQVPEHAYSAGMQQRNQGQVHLDQVSSTAGGAGGPGAGGGSGGGSGAGVEGALKQLSHSNERAWGTMGGLSRAMDKEMQATECYERALVHNPYSPSALAGLGGVYKARGDYRKAVEYLQQAVALDDKDGHTWEELAYCYLMINDLQNSYTAYQHALYHIQNPKDARLWYGIGLLYDCYGSYGHAIEAFDACLKMDPNFELDHEVRFRVGIINKQQGKLDEALAILHDVLQAVNDPAWCGDVWSQIGHVYELKREIKNAKNAYVKALEYNKNHAKALQQLGWLHYKDEDDFRSAIEYLKRASEIDPQEGLGWYLLGRCYMAAQKHESAYQAYEQAVNCDPTNPNVWCSLGVLYYQLHQNRDALDAYTRAIKLDPNLCEVWYNVGTLYDSCNQTTDALDAYKKAAELGASGVFIHERIAALMKKMQTGGGSGSGSGGGVAGGGGLGAGSGPHSQHGQGLGGSEGGHRPPHHTREQMDIGVSHISAHDGPHPLSSSNGLGNGSGAGNGSGPPGVGSGMGGGIPHSMPPVGANHSGGGGGGMSLRGPGGSGGGQGVMGQQQGQQSSQQSQHHGQPGQAGQGPSHHGQGGPHSQVGDGGGVSQGGGHGQVQGQGHPHQSMSIPLIGLGRGRQPQQTRCGRST